MQDFIELWQALGLRSTSKLEDRITILATLLSKRPGKLLELKDPTERMAAILLSLKSLPVSLLFNKGNRHHPDKHHPLRWMPTAPSLETMSPEDWMQFDTDGLHLSSDNAYDEPVHYLFQIDKSISCVLSQGWVKLRISGAQFSQTYYFKQNRSERDELSLEPESQCLLLIEYQRLQASMTSFLRGALIRVKETQFSSEKTAGSKKPGLFRSSLRSGKSSQVMDADIFTGIYDCPVLLHVGSRPGEETSDTSISNHSKGVSGSYPL